MTSTNAARRTFLVLTVGLGCLVCSSACVKDDPIVVGNRDASATAIELRNAVVPKPDDPDVDPPECRTCADTLNTSSSRGTLCRHNGRGSANILNDLVDCLCKDKCVQPCKSYCAGSTREGSCLPCIINGCGALFTECGADTK